MIKEEDIVEIVSELVKDDDIFKKAVIPGDNPVNYKTGFFLREKFIKSFTTLKSKKVFISEYDLKQLIKDGKKRIKIPKDAIVSPLAQEIIQEKGIKVEEER